MKKILPVILVLALIFGIFAGCGPADTPASDNTFASASGPTGDNSEESGASAPVEVDFSQTDGDMFTQRDCDPAYDADKAVTIQLNGTSATASSDSVQISDAAVVIKEEATYILSGSFSGMLIVDAPDTAKLQLVFNGVDITSETSAALYILEADKVFVTLAENTANTLANGGSFTAIDDNNIDGALFSKQDLTLNGSGALTVTSPGGHGIVCKDDLVITGGTYTVNSASHGLDANDSVRMNNALLTIDAGKDAIHAENAEDNAKGFIYVSGGTINAEAEGDGIAASAYMQITDGDIDLLVGGGSENGTKAHSDSFGGFMGGGHGGMGGGRPGQTDADIFQNAATEETGTSMKGLKAANSMLISGGNITVNSADDAIHSDVSITITGGTFSLASGDDAVHAEDALTVTAGNIHISESYEGLEALHIDVQGGDIKLVASDDGFNAAGGTDQSGFTGGRDGMFGGGKPGGMGGGGGFGGMSANSNGSIKISGGTVYIHSSGDGMDANGSLEISGGYTTVVGPTQGDTATLDYDTSGIITGGTFIGTGSTMMAQSFSDSTQGVIALQVGNRSAGTRITLKNTSGNTLISHAPELDFAVVILSSPELVKGETYTIEIGSDTSDFEAS